MIERKPTLIDDWIKKYGDPETERKVAEQIEAIERKRIGLDHDFSYPYFANPREL